MRRCAWLAALASVVAGVVRAQELGPRRAAPAPAERPTVVRVPDDAPTLREAIRRSSPGGVIVVRGEQEPVVVDRPLSILGDPTFAIDRGELVWGDAPCAAPAVTLAGAGEGVVTLAGLSCGFMGECAVPAPAVAGGGFDELRLVDCSLSTFQTVFGGGAYGSPCVEVDVPLVLVAGSHVRGGRADVDECIGLLFGDGCAAVLAPQSTVVALDSTLLGGDGGYLCCHGCACPQTLRGLGGVGGDGVVAREVFQAGSLIAPGSGSTFFVLGPSSIDCGRQPSGVAVVADAHVVLADALRGAPRMTPGASYTLAWSRGGRTRSFWFAEGFQAPQPLPGGSWSFLPAASAVFAGTLPAEPASWTFAVPAAVGLLRGPFTFQAVDEEGTVTRPVSALVGP